MLPPVTSSLALGAVVPMPTLVSAVAELTPLMLPRTSELSCVTLAWAPIAVALFNSELTRDNQPKSVLLAPFELLPLKSAASPMKVLLAPVKFPKPASLPMKVLDEPVVFCKPAKTPKNELLLPVVLANPVSNPKKELEAAVVLLKPAPPPKKELAWPVVLNSPASTPKKELLLPAVFRAPDETPKNELPMPVVFWLPASSPKNELESPVVLLNPACKPKKEFAAPVLCVPAFNPTKRLPKVPCASTRKPPRLNWVAASKTFAVPLPLMLKLLDDCWLVAF